MAYTMLNVFIVPAEQEAAFVAEWKKTTEVFKKQPGFVETHLHRNTGVGDQKYKFINIARWDSVDHWNNLHKIYKPTEYDVPGVIGGGAIYETVVNVYSELIPESERVPHWIGSEPPAGFQ